MVIMMRNAKILRRLWGQRCRELCSCNTTSQHNSYAFFSMIVSSGNENGTVEREAIPNRTLKGFDIIDMIKDEIEEECPRIVSCSDILVLATRDGIVLAGGLYYPVLMGRRDSKESFFDETMAEIPRPNGNITETLRLFSLRGFDERETVALLGGHNIGKIGCEFIQLRFSNFMGTAIPSGFLEELMQKCPDDNSTITKMFNEHTARGLSESAMSYSQGLSALSSFGTSFDNHYYKTLMRGRGLLFADQQLMANEKTAAVVMDYALDEGTKFRTEFAHAMDKLSNIGVLTGFQEEVRHSCSHLNSDQ
ncbi:putative Peroxidase 48 isoform X1 [Nicotiana tabacum]|uniref:Peroxidase 48 isoform X1 n=1 Tax=Nicotiana tabacum TaxID=4097 RepID=A0AC58U955_TOBAC